MSITWVLITIAAAFYAGEQAQKGKILNSILNLVLSFISILVLIGSIV